MALGSNADYLTAGPFFNLGLEGTQHECVGTGAADHEVPLRVSYQPACFTSRGFSVILAPEIVCDGVWRGDGAFEAPGVYTPPWKPIPRPQRVMSYVSLHLVQNLGLVTHVPKEVSPKIVEVGRKAVHPPDSVESGWEIFSRGTANGGIPDREPAGQRLLAR